MSVREYFDIHRGHTGDDVAAAILTLAEVISEASAAHIDSIDAVGQSIDDIGESINNVSDSINSLGPVEVVVKQ